MPQVSVLAGAQDIQMDHAVIIAANTVSEDFHVKVDANLHLTIQVNYNNSGELPCKINERMEESKVGYGN